MRRSLLVAAYVVAVVALAAGAGLGLRHLAKTGLDVTAGLGLALLVIGVLGAGWAAVRLLAGLRRRWWVVTVPALLLVGALALWTVGQAVAASFPPSPELGDRTPSDVGLTSRDVAFPAADGTRLAGWYVPSRNGAAVVLMHGAGSTRASTLDQAAVLAEAGYGVLLVDARGHGESSGRGMDFGWYGEDDARGAVDFLEDQPDVTGQVGLVGLSMGGEQAIGAAGVDVRVAAVVAEGATNRVAEDKAFLDEYGTAGEVQQWVDRLTYAVAGLLTSAPRPPSLRDSVEAATDRADPVAFLLVTAGEVPDEGLAADLLASAGGEQVQVWTVAGAGHTDGLATAPEEWAERVVEFLDEELAP